MSSSENVDPPVGPGTAHKCACHSASIRHANYHNWAVQRLSCGLSHLRIGGWFWLGRSWRRVLVSGFSDAEAVHTHQIQNDRVVHDAIDGRHRRHGIFEYAVPVRKGEVCRDGHAASFVTLSTKLSILPGSLLVTRNGKRRSPR